MKVGIIGIGIMGAALSSRLLDQGVELFVYNRTPDKAQILIDRGAMRADSPRQASEQADIVITLLTDHHAVAGVVHGANGILNGLAPGAVHCDLSTVSPAWAAEHAAEYLTCGKHFVQAPVLGSRAQIQQGTLLLFAGGNESAIRLCRPVWELFTSRIWSVGSAEQAATIKLSCNMLIAHMIMGLGQSLVFAKKSGVDPSDLLEIIQASNLASSMYGSKGKSVITRNFRANFVVDNMLKDLNLAMEQGQRSKTPLPFAALAREMFTAASNHGFGDEDYSASIKILEELAGSQLG